jgi:hypothetical protein
MFENFTWRSIALFMVVLAITSCLMTWGAIIAIDRLIYVNWDKAEGPQRVRPLKFERAQWID